jgi:hypothetical protein
MEAGTDVRDPSELAAALQPCYRDLVVRPSELQGLRTPTWHASPEVPVPEND